MGRIDQVPKIAGNAQRFTHESADLFRVCSSSRCFGSSELARTPDRGSGGEIALPAPRPADKAGEADEPAWWRLRWPAVAACALLILFGVRNISDATGHKGTNGVPRRMAPMRVQPADVWIVESNSHYELYSNGLRIENRFRTTNHHGRSWLSIAAGDLPAGFWSSLRWGSCTTPRKVTARPSRRSRNRC